MINHEKCISMINQVLEQVGILDIVRKDNSVYVGGSLPSYIISQHLANKNDEIVCNDIDLYTTNYVKTLHNFSKYVGNQITLIKRTGVNVTFLIKDIPIQIVTSEFDSFYDDVLGNYDCTLVSAGFYPYENKLYTHQKFLDGIKNKNFLCYYEKSNPRRIAKLTDRAKKWYEANLEIVKLTENANFRPYYKNTQMIHSLQDIVSPPNYVQLYYNKFKCISCKIQQEYLMCKHCVNKVDFEMSTKNQTNNKKITILGGVNGFGKVIGQVAKEYNNQIFSTTRNTEKQNSTIFSFELNKPVSDELMNHILTSDIVVLNAYSTLENDEKIWTTTIDTFDEKLALEKFMINSIGYVKFLKEFVAKRKEQIKISNLTNNIQLVFMDANESKFEGKLSDGKHLELNMAKTATKQIFYTNANLLASLGVLTMCYDPGWLSYHGISVDKIESKSKYLIPPEISAACLLYGLGKTNFDKYIEDKKMIYDCSVYEIIKELIR
ncbi:hypothetical protein Klosneuvirus_3_274 [Klosneuvirus KNV1]|uniref:Uncharacterized protein n=1 Tax=Klosneuvirus KNV1 TaxID=1977640 RepID=A0A1V0SK65_9VIRU|nr:hypothetical protein Klosneuvirus_3_274 [Klosneuvirus KNV1]